MISRVFMVETAQQPGSSTLPLLLQGLHDAELVSLAVSRGERTVQLGFRLVNGEDRELLFRGVHSLRATDFVEQNVVSRVLLSSNHLFSAEDLTNRVQWANRLSDTRPFMSDEPLQRCVDRLQRGELTLFVLEPSWGAELVILSESITEAP